MFSPRLSKDANSCPSLVSGVLFKQSHVVNNLGQQLSVVKATRREVANAVLREAHVALGRVPALSLPQDDAPRVIESAVIPMLTSSADLLTFPSIPLLRSCRAAAVKAVWGTPSAAMEQRSCFFLALTTKAHRVDPFSACACAYTQDIRRALIRCPGIREQFCQVLDHDQIAEVPVSAKCMDGPVQHLRTVMWYLDMEVTSVSDVFCSNGLSSKTVGGGMSCVNVCAKVWWLMFKPVQPKSSPTEKTCRT